MAAKFRKTILIFWLWVLPLLSFGQSYKESSLTRIYEKLALAYGSSKPIPKLEIVTSKSGTPAIYLAKPEPEIRIDTHLFELSRKFGADSLNVMSFIISHELAHYYSDHLYCTNFAFAIYQNNPVLGKEIIEIPVATKVEKETEADLKGMFYAFAAGYNAIDLESKIIDSIYDEYGIPDQVEGYPSRQERKDLSLTAKETTTDLISSFNQGLLAIEEGKYMQAAAIFEEVNRSIPFHEGLNNSGVAKALQGLSQQTQPQAEQQNPRFAYPIKSVRKYSKSINSTFNSSKRAKEINPIDLPDELSEGILKSAEKDLKDAIRLDPSFTEAYINLACVFDIMGNYYAAIGIIKELPEPLQQTKDAKRILAIAYSHLGEEDLANQLWKELGL